MPTIQPGTTHVNLSPLLFHLHAEQFYRAKRRFQLGEERVSPVPYFLLCKAIELELKSRHLESRTRQKVKSEYGHNIKKAYDNLDSTAKVLDTTEHDVLAQASLIYDTPNKGFEYVSVRDAGGGYSNFPDLAVLDRIAQKLIGIKSVSST